MTNPFDAEDLFKRSILSSILGFNCKAKTTGRVGYVKDEEISNPAISVNSGISTFGDLTSCKRKKYRTKQEIYDEIVCECAELEKNRAAALMPNTVEMRSVACSTSESLDMTINQCSPNSNLSTEQNTSITIQNLVRLMVTAVKESGILNDQIGVNSPEDILKRKRLQNNEAAVRYRKRQKELKEEAELELTILMNKNNELKNEIKQMQTEIDQLKARVLKRTSDRTMW